MPILHVHGDADKVVPLEKNSGKLARRYRNSWAVHVQLIVIPGKGHQVCDQFFQCRELVDFVVANCKSTKGNSAIKASTMVDGATPRSIAPFAVLAVVYGLGKHQKPEDISACVRQPVRRSLGTSGRLAPGMDREGR